MSICWGIRNLRKYYAYTVNMKTTHLTIEEIPWARMVHWYGRASNYPKYFQQIRTGTEEQRNIALDRIKNTIEHQDTIIQVTPIALPFIYQLLLE